MGDSDTQSGDSAATGSAAANSTDDSADGGADSGDGQQPQLTVADCFGLDQDAMPPSAMLDVIAVDDSDAPSVGVCDMVTAGSSKIGCCMRSACSDVIMQGSSSLTDEPSIMGFTNTLLCTNLASDPGNCFRDDLLSQGLKTCLMCNSCMDADADVACPAA